MKDMKANRMEDLNNIDIDVDIDVDDDDDDDELQNGSPRNPSTKQTHYNQQRKGIKRKNLKRKNPNDTESGNEVSEDTKEHETRQSKEVKIRKPRKKEWIYWASINNTDGIDEVIFGSVWFLICFFFLFATHFTLWTEQERKEELSKVILKLNHYTKG